MSDLRLKSQPSLTGERGAGRKGCHCEGDWEACVAGVEVEKRWAEHCFHFFNATQLPNVYNFLVVSRLLATRPSRSSNITTTEEIKRFVYVGEGEPGGSSFVKRW